MKKTPIISLKLLAGTFCLLLLVSACRSSPHPPMKDDLLKLDAHFEDPFQLQAQMESLSELPAAQNILQKGAAGADSLLYYIRDPEQTGLARTAMLVLSQMDPKHYYNALLDFLGTADQAQTEALDAGIWQTQVSESQLAKDLVKIVQDHHTPNPLLLLQRPAAQFVENELRTLAAQAPFERYAMMCLKYLPAEE